MHKIDLISFGYKYGVPGHEDRRLDCRELMNPHNHPKLKMLTGLDPVVQAYIEADQPTFKQLFKRAIEVTPSFHEAMKAGHSFCIAFGCIGGKHRSVAMAELVGAYFTAAGYDVSIKHRELKTQAHL